MTLTAALSRGAALALAALALAMIVLGVALPAITAFEQVEADRRLAAASIARLEARVSDRAAFERRIAELEAETAQSDLRLRAETPALAAALVQRRLGEAAARHGARLVSTQSLPEGAEAGLGRVGVRAELDAPLAALVGLLHELESGRPYLFVTRLRARGGAPTPFGSRREDDELSVQLDLVGFVQAEAAS